MKTFAAFAFVVSLASVSFATGPCGPDIETHCGHVQPGTGNIGSCIDSKKDQFSYECREWIKKMDHSLRKLHACSWEARDYCRDIKPGYGRVKSCLKANYDKLSPSCQQALNEN